MVLFFWVIPPPSLTDTLHFSPYFRFSSLIFGLDALNGLWHYNAGCCIKALGAVSFISETFILFIGSSDNALVCHWVYHINSIPTLNDVMTHRNTDILEVHRQKYTCWLLVSQHRFMFYRSFLLQTCSWSLVAFFQKGKSPILCMYRSLSCDTCKCNFSLRRFLLCNLRIC